MRQQAAEANKESTETIVIPRKKTWGKEAVLEALAATVSRDPTAYPYQFQDDSYLAPRTGAEFKLFALSQESGKAAAKYFVDSNPKFFTKDFAEPHIPCLMPENVTLRLEEVSEDALKERITLRRVSAAVDMYDQLLQAGSTVSMETVHNLLDLISLYGDKDPVQEGQPLNEDSESGEEQQKKKPARGRRSSELQKLTWKENNNAERVFNLLPERDTRCYSALIRGMVKHGASSKAFSLYTDLLNNRMTADVHIFNALISAAPDVKEKYSDKWELILELLNQMKEQKIRPNLMTFNSVLKALRRCGGLARPQALNILNEMKAVGIEPSLASFEHVLGIFHKPVSSNQVNTNILHEVMAELEGTSFTCRDPHDVMFFLTAMRICLDCKDLELAYKVNRLLDVGENWRLLGDSYQKTIYYARFFSLLCMMEQLDTVMKWYKQLVPSMYYPSSQALKDLLQALDADNRLDLLPSIWKDIKTLGHDNKSDLVDELLGLMAREKHNAEVQASFAECALDVKSVLEGRPGADWSVSSLSDISTLLLRANKTQQAWDMLQLCKSKNRVPSEAVFSEFLTVCQSGGAPQRAVELVQLSAAFCLPGTAQLANRALQEFDLTEEQRGVLSELEIAGDTLTE